MILSVGSINADFVVRADAAPSGPGSMLARELLRTSGGKAANVAVLGMRLGAPALLIGCVGDDDLADQALAGPRAAGVDISGVRRRRGPTGYSSVVVPPDGAKSIVLAPNANDAWGDDAGAVYDAVAAAPAGSVLVIDLEIPTEVVEAALRAARGRGVTTVLDPAPPARLDDAMLQLAGHLTPDNTEAGDLTGIDTSDDDGAAVAAEQLQDRGAANVYVKLGTGGCVLASADRTVILHAPDDIAVVDATGAGDAFAGALGWALHAGQAPEAAARVAVAASACAVGAYGSQESYPDLDTLNDMAGRVCITRR